MVDDNNVLELGLEIEDLKKEIKHVKSINRKNNVIRNMKIFSGGLRVIYPYIITGGIIFGTFSFLGSTPHYTDNVKVDLLKVIDSNGTSKYVCFEEADFSEESNVIKKYSKWNKKDDGTYVRQVETYILPNDFSDRKINDIVLNNNEKVLDSLELKNEGYVENLYLSKEEFTNCSSYLEAYIFNDEKYKSFIKESDEANKYNTVSFYILFLMFSVFVKLFRNKMINGFKLRKYIESLKGKYPLFELDPLFNELNDKYGEYNRLVRKK